MQIPHHLFGWPGLTVRCDQNFGTPSIPHIMIEPYICLNLLAIEASVPPEGSDTVMSTTCSKVQRLLPVLVGI